MDKLPKQDCV
ncbi:hypothetical protein CGLO_11847 [Colletotrichum gloeosporioides Cg-14]|uniref:Uncharacterized protein n=1 Tax=Colletotrichum gloeosporioides (strain Cg-14) TaxID=1237896 RepID=T0LKV4_COLGC|nr:hypothetical protein CGLO_11847 [Colletotrichum gloeosporioides Cg-14]